MSGCTKGKGEGCPCFISRVSLFPFQNPCVYFWSLEHSSSGIGSTGLCVSRGVVVVLGPRRPQDTLCYGL